MIVVLCAGRKVTIAIHFDHQPLLGTVEIYDVAADPVLSAKLNAKLLSFEMVPKNLLWCWHLRSETLASVELIFSVEYFTHGLCDSEGLS